MKDPVIIRHDGKWHLWASCHPLADPATADRMATDYATSADGLDWTWQGTVLTGRPGAWDARGVRVSAVVPYRPGRALPNVVTVPAHPRSNVWGFAVRRT